MSTDTKKRIASGDIIEVMGARVHNLKNIDVSIPKNKLVVITGISGSGKSSLAFDTIFAEGQRRYMESFAAYARQFMGDLERPDVDKISGLSPVISIEQKTTNRNPRSTVGTVTEVYDFMRLLFARVADAYSYNTSKKMTKFSEEEIIAHIQDNFMGKKIMLLAPVVRGRKGHYRELFEQLRKQGYLKVRVDGEVVELKERMQLDRYKIHDIELVIDRLLVGPDARARMSESVQKSLQMGKDLMFVGENDKNTVVQYSRSLMCADTGISYEEPSPNTFSFNSPYGACPKCKGLGSVYQVNMEEVLPDMNKSINDGGIAPLGEERDAWSFRMVNILAKKNKISLSTPLKNLSEKHLNILLYGNEEGQITYVNSGEEGPKEEITEHNYEGIVNMVLRWFSETSSESVRSWAEAFMQLNTCPECNGARLRKESLYFKIDEKNISELCNFSLKGLSEWFEGIEKRVSKKQNTIAKDILKEIRDRLAFLLEVGLHYLTLDRPTRTLSGGESQRIRLATQIGSQLTGITYILDEPSIGLHQRDNMRLINALKSLRDSGNSVLVVEHDKDIMLASDHLIDIGPAAGFHGGKIVSAGTPAEMLKMKTITAGYLNNTLKIHVPEERKKGNGKTLALTGATGNNLKNVSVKLPLGSFICVSGVSGSGKSTLINETLYPILAKHCYPNFKQVPMPYKKVEGLEHIDKVIEIDQSPIGRTPRSNPATYCGFFNDVRQLFAQVPEAKIRGYNAGRFSFNVKGGRCEECKGGGMRVIEMNFLPDVYVPCEKCNGRRYNRETLEIRYKGKSISDVLNMTVDDAVEFFVNVHFLHRRVKTLQDVGLGYVTIGQSATTLSGGEAQRVKLATELSKKDTGQTIYILDEPTTGLHFEDINHLLSVLNRLVERGNTVLVIEHNMDVIKVADYVIDMGPEGGAGGGKVVAQGTPEDIIKVKESHTGLFLKEELKLAKL
ncbi:excinuclease ABC subunit UvrA [Flavipsychrobacter stenotrophus]|uniref:UvrABC system protein A n=1 Tax=Flavipsychrobacter stenotrophus TaxID=2077091 RepID=A0A2S7SZD3_9BACT|nr:excinuclease ABC subunit UvrA [Flavipsychrobacter stenotrophus]PQJ11977.1 excinuclease ABC subunit UvrA [Flavipsychrobacter stenotrophus]